MAEPVVNAPPDQSRSDLLKTVSGWYEQNRQDASSIAVVLTVTLSRVTTETMAAVVRNVITLLGDDKVVPSLFFLLNDSQAPSAEEIRTLGLSREFVGWIGSLVSRFSSPIRRAFFLSFRPNAFGGLDVSFQQDKEWIALKLRHLGGKETVYDMPYTTWLSAIIDLLKPLVEKRLFVKQELRDGIVQLKEMVGKIPLEETK